MLLEDTLRLVLLLTNCINPAFQEGFTLKRIDAFEIGGGNTNALVTPTKERYLFVIFISFHLARMLLNLL